MMTGRIGSTIGAMVLASVLALPAMAQDAYPSRPVKIVVPFGPGGSTDITARLVAEKLTAMWGGKPVVIENKPGAGGNVGADIVAKAPPDGYTLLLGVTGSNAINPSLFRKMPYDALKDFEPLTLVTLFPNAIVVNKNVPANNLAELIALIKANPDKYSYGSDGNGTASHLTMELLKTKGHFSLTHVPYKGGGAMLTDLLGGQIQIGISGLPSLQQHLQSGQIKMIGITTAKRVPVAPNYPTIAEQGFPGFAASPWSAFFAPKGTPPAVLQKLSTDLVAVLNLPEFRQKMAEMGNEVTPTTPAELRKFNEDEIAKWREAVKVSGAQID
jgi:tripartite-type tricarboxylate transporter receptor subunit TctC